MNVVVFSIYIAFHYVTLLAREPDQSAELKVLSFWQMGLDPLAFRKIFTRPITIVYLKWGGFDTMTEREALLIQISKVTGHTICCSPNCASADMHIHY